MVNRQTSQEIDERAAEWAARIDRGALTEGEEAALETWLAEDTRHVGAYAKARAVLLHTERARALGGAFFETASKAATSSQVPKRGASWFAGVAAAALTCVAVAATLMLHSSKDRFSTRLGETRVIPLDDGSVVTLNTASSVVVSFTRGQRRIELVEGEALFDVAKDPARPFLVAAGDTEVKAIGTSFTVQRLLGKPTEVLVREGLVEVKRPELPVVPVVRVAANNRATAPVDAAIETHAVPAQVVARELAWRVGRIAFEGETLREAAAAFERYSNIRVVIADSRIADETIAGLFVSNDPVGFAKAVALSLGLHAEVSGGEVRLSRAE
jgi:transmembrane sensor